MYTVSYSYSKPNRKINYNPCPLHVTDDCFGPYCPYPASSGKKMFLEKVSVFFSVLKASLRLDLGPKSVAFTGYVQ